LRIFSRASSFIACTSSLRVAISSALSPASVACAHDCTSASRASSCVLVIDEAGTLGAAQAKVLFEKARDAGALVHLLGDFGQHESVGRGAVLRGLVEGYDALDMCTTRRAREEWLREVAQDLRAGVVSRALDVLREKGPL
jgi:ATP-dependent exoDNAse (exonuclease V) alpha subunit